MSEKERKLFAVKIWNPLAYRFTKFMRGYFDLKNDNYYNKARIEEFRCSCCEKCEAYKNKQCVLKGAKVDYCPYGEVRREFSDLLIYGNKAVMDFIAEKRRKYEGVDKTFEYERPSGIKFIGEDWIYVDVDFLNEILNESCFYVDPDGIHNYKLIKKEFFNFKNVNKIVTSVPFSNAGIAIDSYKEKLPVFLLELSKKCPEIYNKLLAAHPELKKETAFDFWAELENNPYLSLGRTAILVTLAPGDVEINGKKWKWDGTCCYDFDSIKDGTQQEEKVDKSLMFLPSKTTECKIIDTKTIKEDTKFLYGTNVDKKEKISLLIEAIKSSEDLNNIKKLIAKAEPMSERMGELGELMKEFGKEIKNKTYEDDAELEDMRKELRKKFENN